MQNVVRTCNITVFFTFHNVITEVKKIITQRCKGMYFLSLNTMSSNVVHVWGSGHLSVSGLSSKLIATFVLQCLIPLNSSLILVCDKRMQNCFCSFSCVTLSQSDQSWGYSYRFKTWTSYLKPPFLIYFVTTHAQSKLFIVSFSFFISLGEKYSALIFY